MLDNWPNRICIIDGCDGELRTKGFCSRHYQQFKTGIIDSQGKKIRELKRRILKKSICLVKDCTIPPASLGFCGKHYQQTKIGIRDEKGNPIRKTNNEIHAKPTYGSLVNVHNGIHDGSIRASLKEIAKTYTCFCNSDFNRLGRSYNELVQIHNDSAVHMIRKNTKTQATQMPEFNDNDFNRLNGTKIPYEELVKLHNESNDNKERTLLKSKARGKHYEFTETDFDNEERAFLRYFEFVRFHNAEEENGIKRNTLKTRAKKIRNGRFFKENHFNRLRIINKQCLVQNCNRKAVSKKLCTKHYGQCRNKIIDENGNTLRELKKIFKS